jgi:hypothetical protein
VFLDQVKKNADEGNQLVTDVSGSSFCAAGAAIGEDGTPLPTRQVTFEYRSNGTVKKANSKRVQGEFGSVELTLVIEDDVSGILYEASTDAGCTLKARINKSGEQGKSRLKCKLGDDMSALGLNQAANTEFKNNVEAAFPKKSQGGSKNVKVKVDKGQLRIRVNGEPAPPGFEPAVDCTSPSPTPSPE